MNLTDIILIIVIAAAVVLAVIHCLRSRKRGNTCCNNCSSCTYNCKNERKNNG